MSAATPAEVVAACAKGTLAPCYWIAGKERFLVERTAHAVRAAVSAKDPHGLSSDLLQAPESPAATALSAARTPPMLAPRRLVVVRGVDLYKAAEQDALAPYCADPAPTTVLVLLGESTELRPKLRAAIDKKGVAVRCDPLRDRDLRGFLRDEARAQGVALDADAASLLIESIGADLAALAGALERVALYVGDKRPLTAEDVEACVVGSRSRSVFELCDAVGRGDLGGALTVMARMLADREKPLGMVAMLARHVRQLWSIRELAKRKMPPPAIAEKLGIRPFLMDNLLAQARRMNERALRRAHDALCAADLALKGSRLDEERVLEQLVFRMIGSESTQQTARAPRA